MRQLVYKVCYTRYQVLFYFCWSGSVVKYCKVPKYYDQDCNLKPEIDKLDIGKLGNTPVDLSQLIDVVKSAVVKKTVHDKLLHAIQTTDTSNLVKKAS